MARCSQPPPFLRRRGQRAALAAVIAALLPGAAGAEAGRVTFAHGTVAATAADGTRRALARGAELEAGDTIRTGERGHAQLRFTDGSFVSLDPESEFRIDEYRHGGEAETEERGFFSLLRGGLRTVTGIIGRARKAAYRMNTPVATIGIRGTEYRLELEGVGTDNPRLDWNVADDGSSVITVVLPNGQERVIAWGGAGSATRAQFEAVLLALQQLVAEGRLETVGQEQIEEVFASGEVVDETGRALELLLAALLEQEVVVPPPDCASAPQSCTLTTAFGAIDADGGEGLPVAGVAIDGGEGSVVGASFDANGALTSYSSDLDGGEGFSGFIGGVRRGLESGQVGTAQSVRDGSANFSVDPANPEDPQARASWGRWIAPAGGDGQSTGDEPHPLGFEQGTQQAFAWAVSIPPAVLFNQGTAQYTIAGFTPPSAIGTNAGILGAPGAVTGTFTADFAMQQVGFNVDIGFANGSYNIQPSGGALGLDTGPGFTGIGKPFFGGSIDVTGSGAACGGDGCGGVAGGNLFGPQADGAALGYKIDDDGINGYVTGVGVFQQQSCSGCARVE